MNQNQKAFIESVVAIDNKSNHSLLETALKLYVINEGLDDFINFVNRKRDAHRAKIMDHSVEVGENAAAALSKFGSDATRLGRRIGRRIGSTVGHVGRTMTSDPSAMSRIPTQAKSYDITSAKAAVESERFVHTWDAAYRRFLQACDYVGFFIANYGTAEISKFINSDDFKESLAIGDEIDRLRPSPMFKDNDRVKTYLDIVESIRTPENSGTIDAIVSLFEASESYTSIVPLTENAIGQNLMVLKNELACIRNFNVQHGSTPWRRWFNQHKAAFALGSVNNWANKPATPTTNDDEDDE